MSRKINEELIKYMGREIDRWLEKNVESAHSTEYKIVTEGDWSGVYFRCKKHEDWIFMTEYFGKYSAEKANRYLEAVKNNLTEM